MPDVAALVERLRAGPRRKGGFIPVQFGLTAEIKYFGRFKGGYPRRRVVGCDCERLGRSFRAVAPVWGRVTRK